MESFSAPRPRPVSVHQDTGDRPRALPPTVEVYNSDASSAADTLSESRNSGPRTAAANIRAKTVNFKVTDPEYSAHTSATMSSSDSASGYAKSVAESSNSKDSGYHSDPDAVHPGISKRPSRVEYRSSSPDSSALDVVPGRRRRSKQDGSVASSVEIRLRADASNQFPTLTTDDLEGRTMTLISRDGGPPEIVIAAPKREAKYVNDVRKPLQRRGSVSSRRSDVWKKHNECNDPNCTNCVPSSSQERRRHRGRETTYVNSSSGVVNETTVHSPYTRQRASSTERRRSAYVATEDRMPRYPEGSSRRRTSSMDRRRPTVHYAPPSPAYYTAQDMMPPPPPALPPQPLPQLHHYPAHMHSRPSSMAAYHMDHAPHYNHPPALSIPAPYTRPSSYYPPGHPTNLTPPYPGVSPNPFVTVPPSMPTPPSSQPHSRRTSARSPSPSRASMPSARYAPTIWTYPPSVHSPPGNTATSTLARYSDSNDDQGSSQSGSDSEAVVVRNDLSRRRPSIRVTDEPQTSSYQGYDSSADHARRRRGKDEVKRKRQENNDQELAKALAEEEERKQERFELPRSEARRENRLAESEKRRASEREEARRKRTAEEEKRHVETQMLEMAHERETTRLNEEERASQLRWEQQKTSYYNPRGRSRRSSISRSNSSGIEDPGTGQERRRHGNKDAKIKEEKDKLRKRLITEDEASSARERKAAEQREREERATRLQEKKEPVPVAVSRSTKESPTANREDPAGKTDHMPLEALPIPNVPRIMEDTGKVGNSITVRLLNAPDEIKRASSKMHNTSQGACDIAQLYEKTGDPTPGDDLEQAKSLKLSTAQLPNSTGTSGTVESEPLQRANKHRETWMRLASKALAMSRASEWVSEGNNSRSSRESPGKIPIEVGQSLVHRSRKIGAIGKSDDTGPKATDVSGDTQSCALISSDNSTLEDQDSGESMVESIDDTEDVSHCDVNIQTALDSAMNVVKGLLLRNLLDHALPEAMDGAEGSSSSKGGSSKGSTGSTSGTSSSLSSRAPATNKDRKRTRGGGRDPGDGGDDGSGDDDDERPKKKGSPDRFPHRRLKCPFYQRQPEKYTKHACRGEGFVDMAKLKDHLKRVHTQPLRCSRCRIEMESEDDLEEHLNRDDICKKRPAPQDDRIRPQMLRKLDFKKAPFVNARNTEEKWKMMYKVLFPGDSEADIPSPYDHNTLSPGLARALSEALEEELTLELAPILEPIISRVKERIPAIIERCRAKLQRGISPASDEVVYTPTATRSTVSGSSDGEPGSSKKQAKKSNQAPLSQCSGSSFEVVSRAEKVSHKAKGKQTHRVIPSGSSTENDERLAASPTTSAEYSIVDADATDVMQYLDSSINTIPVSDSNMSNSALFAFPTGPSSTVFPQDIVTSPPSFSASQDPILRPYHNDPHLYGGSAPLDMQIWGSIPPTQGNQTAGTRNNENANELPPDWDALVQDMDFSQFSSH